MAMPITITLPANLDSLYESMSFVVSHARNLGFDDEKIGEIKLALEEVLVNIYKYAYRNSDLDGTVEITCKLSDAQDFVIQIIDSGVPFDILTVQEPDVTAEIDDREIGGLGIFFVRRLVDDVRYRREGGENILTLMLHRPQHKA